MVSGFFGKAMCSWEFPHKCKRSYCAFGTPQTLWTDGLIVDLGNGIRPLTASLPKRFWGYLEVQCILDIHTPRQSHLALHRLQALWTDLHMQQGTPFKTLAFKWSGVTRQGSLFWGIKDVDKVVWPWAGLQSQWIQLQTFENFSGG